MGREVEQYADKSKEAAKDAGLEAIKEAAKEVAELEHQGVEWVDEHQGDEQREAARENGHQEVGREAEQEQREVEQEDEPQGSENQNCKKMPSQGKGTGSRSQPEVQTHGNTARLQEIMDEFLKAGLSRAEAEQVIADVKAQ